MMSMVIIDYGVGNLASIRNALEYLQVTARVTSDLDEIGKADKIILPGVGAFQPAITRLQEKGLAQLIQEKADKGCPILGICLGMQLLFTVSEENGVWPGLDLIPGKVTRFRNVHKIPHMGWNQVKWKYDSILNRRIPQGADFYFVHSYYCLPGDPGTILGVSEYGREFCSVIENENVFGVQFHPEKSHHYGLQLLKNFADL